MIVPVHIPWNHGREKQIKRGRAEWIRSRRRRVPDYLQATAVVCAVARESGGLEVIVNMSQMTVSQMTLTSTEESRQHRLHWLAEHVMNWSGVPVIHIRPTVFLENPLFTFLAMRSIRERGVLSLPFGTGRTSPIAATDVARVVATVLQDPAGRIGDIYELTGPEVLDIDGLAAQYAPRAHSATHRHDGPAAPRRPLQPGDR